MNMLENSGMVHIYSNVAYRLKNGPVRIVPAGKRDWILLAADLPALLPHRYHIVGVVLDQPRSRSSQSYTGSVLNHSLEQTR